jgi:hypothetical protein
MAAETTDQEDCLSIHCDYYLSTIGGNSPKTPRLDHQKNPPVHRRRVHIRLPVFAYLRRNWIRLYLVIEKKSDQSYTAPRTILRCGLGQK